MRDKLPVYVENRELPVDEYKNMNEDKNHSYGYVSVMYLTSLIITIVSLVVVIMMWNR